MTDEQPTPPINRRRRRLATGAAVLGAGVLLAGPITAFAQQDDDDTETDDTEVEDTEVERRGGWISDALDNLVAAGTITQAQADAVSEALEEARPEGRFPGRGGHRWFGGFGAGRIAVDAAAEVLGIAEDELRDALREGTTIAELAEQNGVAVQSVIDALVAEAKERLDALVADGRLDAAESAERLAEITERITTFVNEGFPNHDERIVEGPDEPDDDTDTDATTPTTTTG